MDSKLLISLDDDVLDHVAGGLADASVSVAVGNLANAGVGLAGGTVQASANVLGGLLSVGLGVSVG